jgi:hypothetical protein
VLWCGKASRYLIALLSIELVKGVFRASVGMAVRVIKSGRFMLCEGVYGRNMVGSVVFE